MEKLATEFQRDPLTFCWVDLNAQPTDKRALWQTQFGNASARTLRIVVSVEVVEAATNFFIILQRSSWV